MSETYKSIKGPKMEYPQSTLHKLLEDQALLRPKSFALQYETEYITYGDLSIRVNQMAHYLWAEGVRPGTIVAISLSRTPNLIITLFAILQCGASYVPIDTEYPASRAEFIALDSGSAFIITETTKNIKGIKNRVISDILTTIDEFPSHPLDVNVDTQSIAYIMYTSGSTGRPKGVKVMHKGLINLIYASGKNLNITTKDKFLSATTISFDPMVMEMILPLIFGACVVFVDDFTRRDGQALLKKAIAEEITVINGTPSFWQILLDSGWKEPLSIKILCGGEALTTNLSKALIPKCLELWNMYGPTETSVCCFMNKISLNDNPITIGKPIANTEIYLLDENKRPVPPGEIGEIAIGGDGVSLGYVNRPELDDRVFVSLPNLNKTDNKIYLSGDLGRVLPNGEVQCVGRKDHQVKIRGHRIELGEIEAALDALPQIKRSAVIVSKKFTNDAKLVAYIQSNDQKKDLTQVRNSLLQALPDFMVPSFFMWIDEFPITSNEKIDKNKLPPIEYKRPETAPLLRNPRTKLEKDIAEIWTEELLIPEIGIDDNFFELGGTSILTQKVATRISNQLKVDLTATKIYQNPTIFAISEYLDSEKNILLESPDYGILTKENPSNAVAIIGMSGRFPGADNIDELWEVLRNGKETISHFTPEELDGSIPASVRNDSNYIPSRGVLQSCKTFDASFFGINPKMAEAMDPQHRVFLEIAWEALEQSGYIPYHFSGSVGVYAGTGVNSYYLNNVLKNNDLVEGIGNFQLTTINDKDYIASRTSYHLNLKGPSVSIHSACSTSLLAIAQAVQAIRNGDCDMALAGGVSVTAPVNSGHLYEEGAIFSEDGHCRPFDANAKGTVFSDGAGVVLLKNLETAQKDGDTIYGIIKGIGVNNDGGNKGSFTAPSALGQALAIKKALADAQISPDTISYIEAHGTATPMGDPIEIEGLQLAFGQQNSSNFCAIGSIKSNMGHLTAAAGVAGLIKTVLAMYYKQIPPSLGFEKPNPAIDFENSPFYVNQKLSPWESETTRRAGVSSFGVGGTNVHVILEEFSNDLKPESKGRPLELLTWSAKTQNSLIGYQMELGHYLKKYPETPLADVAYSLQTTRGNFNHKGFALTESHSKTADALLNNSKIIKSTVAKVMPSEVAFLYTGQGSQYSNMGKSLYENEKVYRDAIDACAILLTNDLEMDIRDILFPIDNLSTKNQLLNNTQYTQPALFVTEYALTQLWLSWGIKPTLLCGHSIGEFVAAHIAGIFNLEDALHLVATRGKLMGALPKGSMLSVRLPYETLKPLMPQSVSLAAINSSQACVVAGESVDIASFEKKLTSLDIACKILATSHAFHSFMMDPILEIFKMEVAKVQKNIPRLPIVSTFTGTWLTDTEALDPGYWTNHLRHTVQFGEAINTILTLEETIFLEIGPGHTLTTLARQQAFGKILNAFTSLPSEIKDSTNPDYQVILNTLGNLWLHGLTPDWKVFYGEQKRQKIKLPSYVFDRKPCWIDPPLLKEEKSFKHINHTVRDITIESSTKNLHMRKNYILNKISEIVSSSSGIDYQAEDASYSFIDLGLDSLALTQLSLKLKKEFHLPITFRQLNEEFGSPNLLAEYIDENTKAEDIPFSNVVQNNTSGVAPVPHINTNQGSLDLIQQQIQLLSMQINLMQGNNNFASNTNPPAPLNNPINPNKIVNDEILTEEEKKEHRKPFGASPKIEKQNHALNSVQLKFLKDLEATYNQKTQKSKDYAQNHRSFMADPRVVSGFRPLTKEMVYPLVIKKSSGNRLWDLDNNEYIDTLNGFGSCLLGHQPDFIKQALHDQIENGYEVGPQHPLAGDVCKLLCEFTGHERAALCNTGSEAVLGAVRIARTVTGRSLIVSFSGSYHGINDEALVRGSKKLKTFPAAAGILLDNVQNVLVLEYGTNESLNIIKERGHEIAAVLVEPVQSRRPEFQPIDFLKELRNITQESKSLLVFDEVITGFRSHPGGVQALFGIKADIATYGKVIGGGISIGAILGRKDYMDALDGGFWQYGDQSIPEVGVTYFAGTFVRHPLALAAAKASLLYMKEQGSSLQQNLTAMTTSFAEKLVKEFQNRMWPVTITHFSSLWRLKFTEDIPYSELLFVLLRNKGIHIMDGFPCFMTTAFTPKDIEYLTNSIIDSIEELADVSIILSTNTQAKPNGFSNPFHTKLTIPPVPGARLGRDESGNPAWFIEDANDKNKYVKISL